MFAEPWQAQAFALAVALNERGVFTWSEWWGTLSRELARDDEPTMGRDITITGSRPLEALIHASGLMTRD